MHWLFNEIPVLNRNSPYGIIFHEFQVGIVHSIFRNMKQIKTYLYKSKVCKAWVQFKTDDRIPNNIIAITICKYWSERLFRI